MTLDELIRAVQKKSGNEFTLVESRLAIESVLGTLKELMVNHDAITIKNFGKIGSKLKKGHIGRNPNTMKEHKIPDHYIPFFSPCGALKSEVF